MRLALLPQAFSVCRLADAGQVDLSREFVFFARTDRELSLVCPSRWAPEGALAREDGWRALRVEGVLDFSLVGILAGITGALAAAGVPVFALSTYDTDYLLVKEDRLNAALTALKGAGYTLLVP